MDLEIKKGNKKAVLLGATGLVGQHCLKLLVEHDAYDEILCLTRRPLNMKSGKITNQVIDFKELEEYADLICGDDLFLFLGTTKAKAGSKRAFYEVDFSYNYKSAMYAKKNGMSQALLVSSVGANSSSLFFYTRVKGELEKTIKDLGFWSTHIFRPSLLQGKREEPRLKEELAVVLGKGINLLTKGGLANLTPIDAKQVAEAMVNAAQKIKKGINYYESNQLRFNVSYEK